MGVMVVLGDSHSRYFRHAGAKGLLLPFDVKICEVSGATAAGLANPSSTTAAAKKYRQLLGEAPKDAFVVMHLGEVDCGILIWLRSQRNRSPLLEEMQRSVEAYFAFVDQVVAEGFNNVVITGATVPTINDTDHVGSIVTERRAKVEASHLQRTELTRRFNDALRIQADRRSLIYVDIWGEVIDPLTQVADLKFRNKNIKDHHMDLSAASMAWALALRQALSAKVDMAARHIFMIAKDATFIRALDQHPSTLADDMKISIEKGQKLAGRLVARTDKSMVLNDVTLDGKHINERFRYIFGPRWKNATINRTF